MMAAKRLHQMIAAGYDATVSFDRALPRTAHRVFGTVTDIDAAVSRLTLDDGSVLDYDYLVYAVGSGQLPSTIGGAAEHGSASPNSRTRFASNPEWRHSTGRLRSALSAAVSPESRLPQNWLSSEAAESLW